MKNWQRLKENPALWERFFVREKTLRVTRQFFEMNNFHEVEVPILIGKPPGESYVDVFATTVKNRLGMKQPAYLATSPELPLKKLLVAGIGNCFCITKSFRNGESHSKTHNPEFSILEWYRVGVGYEAIMEDMESWIQSLAQSFGYTHSLHYQDMMIDLATPWERLTIRDAFSRYADIDFDLFLDPHEARRIAQMKGYTLNDKTTWEEIYNQIFLNEVEKHLGKTKPTILMEFPSCMAALAKHKKSDPRYALRFEVYIGGLELADAYEELTDPIEQEKRFEEELVMVKQKGNTTYDYDHDFIDALRAGLPDCSGIAVGLDRIMMLFSNVTSITDVLFFPSRELFDHME